MSTPVRSAREPVRASVDETSAPNLTGQKHIGVADLRAQSTSNSPSCRWTSRGRCRHCEPCLAGSGPFLELGIRSQPGHVICRNPELEIIWNSILGSLIAAWSLSAADAMVDIPPGPVNHLPHQRLFCSHPLAFFCNVSSTPPTSTPSGTSPSGHPALQPGMDAAKKLLAHLLGTTVALCRGDHITSVTGG